MEVEPLTGERVLLRVKGGELTLAQYFHGLSAVLALAYFVSVPDPHGRSRALLLTMK